MYSVINKEEYIYYTDTSMGYINVKQTWLLLPEKRAGVIYHV